MIISILYFFNYWGQKIVQNKLSYFKQNQRSGGDSSDLYNNFTT